MTPQDLKQIEKLLKEQDKRFGKKFATKNDLKTFATKNDLKTFATKNDLKTFATKDDLQDLKKVLLDSIEDSRAEIISAVDEHKADKEDIKNLNKRVDKLEQAVFS